MAATEQQEYVSYNGELYLYWRGNFYKKRFNGELRAVLDHTLVLDLLPLLKDTKAATA